MYWKVLNQKYEFKNHDNLGKNKIADILSPASYSTDELASLVLQQKFSELDVKFGSWMEVDR